MVCVHFSYKAIFTLKNFKYSLFYYKFCQLWYIGILQTAVESWIYLIMLITWWTRVTHYVISFEKKKTWNPSRKLNYSLNDDSKIFVRIPLRFVPIVRVCLVPALKWKKKKPHSLIVIHSETRIYTCYGVKVNFEP